MNVALYKNGSLIDEVFRRGGATGVAVADHESVAFVDGSSIQNAAADDYYEVFLYHNTGSDSLAVNYSNGYASFSGVLLG